MLALTGLHYCFDSWFYPREPSAGTEFNLSIASTNARQFIIAQTTQSVFEYKKNNRGYEVNKTLQGLVKI